LGEGARRLIEAIEMPRIILFIAALALAACADMAGGQSAATPDPSGWQLASGKPPSQAEFAALAATCQDKGAAIDACLLNLGLKRAR